MKTSELTWLQLDYAVALIEYPKWQWQVVWECYEGYVEVFPHDLSCDDSTIFSPSTDWAQGGPIIEREMVNLDSEGYPWRATVEAPELSELNFIEGCGPTPLIAAMRCYVQSKLGDDIEIPEELK